jgi:hypothetical protein
MLVARLQGLARAHVAPFRRAVVVLVTPTPRIFASLFRAFATASEAPARAGARSTRRPMRLYAQVVGLNTGDASPAVMVATDASR